MEHTSEGERLKLLRKHLDIKQGDFADKISTTQGHISDIENGRKNLSDRTIKLICLESWNGKMVNEEWLRYGTGGEENIFLKVPPYEQAYNRFGYIMENSSPSKKAALSVLLELLYNVPDEQWDMIMKQYDEIKKEG